MTQFGNLRQVDWTGSTRHSNSFTSEQQRQAHSPGDTVHVVDNVAHRSVVAAIFCLTFSITLQDCIPTSTNTRNCLHDKASSGVRTALPVFCPLHAADSSHPHLQRPSVERRTSTSRLTVLSGLSTGLPWIDLATWRLEELVSAVRARQLPTL